MINTLIMRSACLYILPDLHLILKTLYPKVLRRSLKSQPMFLIKASEALLKTVRVSLHSFFLSIKALYKFILILIAAHSSTFTL